MIVLRDKYFDQTEESPSKNNRKRNLLVGTGIAAGAVPGVIIGSTIGENRGIKLISNKEKPIKRVRKLLETRDKKVAEATRAVLDELPSDILERDKREAIYKATNPITKSYKKKISKAEVNFVNRHRIVGGTVGALATAGITAGGIYAVNKYRHRKRNDNIEK